MYAPSYLFSFQILYLNNKYLSKMFFFPQNKKRKLN